MVKNYILDVHNITLIISLSGKKIWNVHAKPLKEQVTTSRNREQHEENFFFKYYFLVVLLNRLILVQNLKIEYFSFLFCTVETCSLPQKNNKDRKTAFLRRA